MRAVVDLNFDTFCRSHDASWLVESTQKDQELAQDDHNHGFSVRVRFITQWTVADRVSLEQ